MNKLTVTKQPLPEASLLYGYHQDGAYTDCYAVRVPGLIRHEEFIFAFYTTWLFKIERLLLKWFISKSSTDEDALALANATQNTFSAWTVETRTASQLLMCDIHGRTRSWLMTKQQGDEVTPCSQLYFGSAVVPRSKSNSQHRSSGIMFNSLLGFHKIYSNALLYLAARKLN